MLARLARLGVALAIGADAVVLISPARATDTVDTLAADPDRLREIQKWCSQDWGGTGDALCKMASQARRKRFMGNGRTPYTPHPVEIFPSQREGSPQGGAAKPQPAMPNTK
ncbi:MULTISPECIES: hypothetical protein [unclassified Nitrobacter]|uniref:hypothetical protein n=1 Tax=unclassified Nitrobacter TaxID=2620411 RepID=UPI00092B7CF7|nr:MULTISPECIES: hypothetical protein [unclassified Nitrobacter]MBN9147926.1 hypothetical protein [Nitrobacter sp.]MBN9489912.1 entry exclusion lipoprotein TrbK [Alphaproteobacteria bacterium]OJV01418.1 MAG: hypothetical protein BGO16_12730 [Nitrobacter sp. 62-23]